MELKSAMMLNSELKCDSLGPVDKEACQMGIINHFPPACGMCMMENVEHPEKCVPAMEAPCTHMELKSAMTMNSDLKCDSLGPVDKEACQMGIINRFPPACGMCMMENVE